MMYGQSSLSNTTEEEGKIFVGGLGWDVTESQLRDYFGKFGEIESVNVKMNPQTGKSRGFAFMVFKSKEGVDEVMKHSDHMINGRKADPKRALARTGKVFVGGLRAEITDDDVKNHFSQYGKILEVEVPFDKVKNQRRGFCFITFEQEHVANDLLKDPKQIINGHHIDLRKAQPKAEFPPGTFPPSVRGGYQGYGGRGGYNAASGYGASAYDTYGASDGYSGYYGSGYNSGSGGYSGYDYSGAYGAGGGSYDYNNGHSYGGQSDGYEMPSKRGGYGRHDAY